MSDRRDVHLEVHRDELGGRGERVEVLGEFCDWINAKKLARRDDGTFAIDLNLQDGVYAYKYRVDGEWRLDPRGRRTRSLHGVQNSVLSIGGAPEPILHAPRAPYVVADDCGGVTILAALRRGAGDSLSLRWSEDAERGRTASMERFIEGDEDEHIAFRARIPASASCVRYTFELADGTSIGREDGASFEYRLPRAAEKPPAWWNDAIVYTIYVDRFRPENDREDWSRDPGRHIAHGGHLDGIRRSLPNLVDLGINTLYLTPIHIAESSHRYDFVDPTCVDPLLGGDEAFAKLITEAHERGVRILLDFSLSHAGLGFAQCRDVLEKGRASKFADWFLWSDKPNEEPTLLHYGKRKDAPLVNLDHPDVKAMAIELAEAWARRGIDGFRLDMAAEVPTDLARTIREKMKLIKTDSIVVGEVVPQHAWRWINEGAVDAATDFAFHAVVTDLLARGAISPSEAISRWRAAEASRGVSDHASLRFLSTHDHPRFASIAKFANQGHGTALGLVALLTMPGVPSLLYGEELGLVADVHELMLENVWPDRMPMPWTDASQSSSLRQLVRKLLHTRRSIAALRTGNLSFEHADESLLVYRRAGEGEVIDVVIHLGREPIEVRLSDDEVPGLEPLVTLGSVTINGDAVTFGAYSAAIFRRRRSERALLRVAAQANLVGRDREFVANGTRGIARPTRIDFAVTERCNLRCEHCITFAPARTESGTARTLTPWVLDHIRDDLRFADYFGFVHGGESLTAPIFFDVLTAIREARGQLPYTVHLLSNGVMLTEKTTAKLIDAGVRSIAVSLDGATAATNDAIRTGGRFDKIVQNLRDAVDLRRSANVDLRIGLSYVVMQSNRHELNAFMDLAADIGVDWVKLEEAVPVNAFAKNSLVMFGEKKSQDEAKKAAAHGRSRGLVVVDHTTAPVIWRCRFNEEPQVAAFVRDDEFANRSIIHPCRVHWETACVEPNGDVRISDFFGQILGNVTTSRMADLWRSQAARSARVRSQQGRLCGPTGPIVCVDDPNSAKKRP